MFSFTTQVNSIVLVLILPAVGFHLDHHFVAENDNAAAANAVPREKFVGETEECQDGCGTLAGQIHFLCDSNHGDHFPCPSPADTNGQIWPGCAANLHAFAEGELGRAFELDIHYENGPNDQVFTMHRDSGRPNGFYAHVFAKDSTGSWNMPVSFVARMKDDAKVNNAQWVHLNTGMAHVDKDGNNYWPPGMDFTFSPTNRINYLDIVMVPTNSCRIHPTVSVRDEDGTLAPFQNNYSWKDSTGGLQFKYAEGKALDFAGPAPLVRDFDNEGKATVWVEGMDNTQSFGNMNITSDLVQLPDDLEVESNGCAVIFVWAFEEFHCDIVLRHKKQQPTTRNHKFWGP